MFRITDSRRVWIFLPLFAAAHATAEPQAAKPAAAVPNQRPATIRECQEFLRVGQYQECLVATTDAIERRSYGEDWPLLKADVEVKLGRYDDAAKTLEAGLTRYNWSIRLRMQWYALCPVIGETAKANQLLSEIHELATTSPWRYTDADDLVALGRAAIELGADPKDVLEGFFDRARKNYQTRVDGYLAAGELAIDKGDLALAAELLRPALERFPESPDICFALASAVASSSAEEAGDLIQKCLSINSKYAPALQRVAEGQVDAEAFSEAEATIKAIHQTNPWHPESNALMAVIHHLHNRPEKEIESRAAALKFSPENPAVDYLIGEKLSRKYRFREGAVYQRKALAIAPDYLPAQIQLAQDLLRLGEDTTGWEMAEQAQKRDKYSTTLFNLMQLRDSLDDFETRETDHFIIRMTKRESAVYGQHVESLLTSAFETLSEKYGYVPGEPIVVEIFDRPDDFAVRTFGIPDVAGFLGVCFGKLITANSPASMRQSPNNWESVLWHEFCHVITLQMTGNRIPRWLSEGISVYEERLQDNRWGQWMSPSFRERIKVGNVTPVSQLSSAFLNAKSGEDLNFAYYESSMVVEFIVQEHGFDALTGVLKDLNRGLNINDALGRHTNGIEQLDETFSAYLKELASAYAKDVEFIIAEQPPGERPAVVPKAERDNPNNYTTGMSQAVRMIREGDLTDAEEKLRHLIELFPEDVSPRGARPVLATVYERLEKPEEQASILAEHLQRSGDDLASAMQLLSLQIAADQWPEALETGRLAMAIDPLQLKLLRDLLLVSQKTDDEELSLQCLTGLLELEPADAARTHYRIAKILQARDSDASRRHVLLALEQAPRYRDAHRLLLELPARESAAATSVRN